MCFLFLVQRHTYISNVGAATLAASPFSHVLSLFLAKKLQNFLHSTQNIHYQIIRISLLNKMGEVRIIFTVRKSQQLLPSNSEILFLDPITRETITMHSTNTDKHCAGPFTHVLCNPFIVLQAVIKSNLSSSGAKQLCPGYATGTQQCWIHIQGSLSPKLFF